MKEPISPYFRFSKMIPNRIKNFPHLKFDASQFEENDTAFE